MRLPQGSSPSALRLQAAEGLEYDLMLNCMGFLFFCFIDFIQDAVALLVFRLCDELTSGIIYDYFNDFNSIKIIRTPEGFFY